MRSIYFFIGLLTILNLTSCSDSSTGYKGIGDSEKSLAARLINTGSENLEAETGTDGTINFCFEGEGKVEIVRGESYRDDGGFLEFTPSKVVHTSDIFTEGDVVDFSLGETE